VRLDLAELRWKNPKKMSNFRQKSEFCIFDKNFHPFFAAQGATFGLDGRRLTLTGDQQKSQHLWNQQINYIHPNRIEEIAARLTQLTRSTNIAITRASWSKLNCNCEVPAAFIPPLSRRFNLAKKLKYAPRIAK